MINVFPSLNMVKNRTFLPSNPSSKGAEKTTFSMPQRLGGLEKDTVSFNANPAMIKVFKDPSFDEKSGDCWPGYRVQGSVGLKQYKGPMAPESGISTPVGLMRQKASSSWNTPISTSGIGNCAVMVLVDSAHQKHFLYHDLTWKPDKDVSAEIPPMVRENFDKAFIVPGNNETTENSINSFYSTVKNLNPDAPIAFRHFPSDGQEVVAYQGDVYFIPAKDPQATFKEIDY